MRLFIAIDIPSVIQERIARVACEIAAKVEAVRPVRAGNIHLTLQFLGEVYEGKRDEISEVVSSVAASNEPFDIRVAGLGAFGRRRRPSVLWAGIESSEGLLKIHSELGEGLANISIESEDKGFHPHLTIARVRPGLGVKRLPTLLDEYADREFGELHVAGISLVKSVLTPDGAVYETLLAAPLSQ